MIILSPGYDLYFSLPFIKVRKEDNGLIVIENLPMFILPGLGLTVRDRNTGENYEFNYQSGLVDWHGFFNKLPSELQEQDELD